eukprot:4307561-Prymnesium_polylepis.2
MDISADQTRDPDESTRAARRARDVSLRTAPRFPHAPGSALPQLRELESGRAESRSRPAAPTGPAVAPAPPPSTPAIEPDANPTPPHSPQRRAITVVHASSFGLRSGDARRGRKHTRSGISFYRSRGTVSHLCDWFRSRRCRGCVRGRAGAGSRLTLGPRLVGPCGMRRFGTFALSDSYII